MGTHLITGAGSGIGAAVARRLAERGEELWLLARNAVRAKELAAQFPGAKTLVGDLATPEKLSWAFGQQPLPDRLDSLQHIAGVIELGAVGDLPAKAWQRQLAANLVAPAEITRLMLPMVRRRPGARRLRQLRCGAARQRAVGRVRREQARAEGAGRLAPGGGARQRRPGDLGLPGAHRHADAGEHPPAGGQGVRPVALDRPGVGRLDGPRGHRPAAGRGDQRRVGAAGPLSPPPSPAPSYGPVVSRRGDVRCTGDH